MTDLSLERSDAGLEVSVGGAPVLDYRVDSDVLPVNTPKPYFHPLRSLAGTIVTGFAPDDHPWHHGLQFAFPRVGDHNLWGGGTYFGPDEGYRVVEDQGSIRHDGWDSVEAHAATARAMERLSWLGHGGDLLLTEERSMTVTARADDESPSWVLELHCSLTNATDDRIALETPAQRGRPDGGYGGLFLRLAENVQADRLVGESGDLDASGGASRTLVIHAHTPAGEQLTLGLSFLEGESPGAQKWLYRFAPEPFSAVGWAGAYDDGFELGSGESIRFGYRLAVLDGTVPPETVRALL
ncbi:DUF6807 family protein [Salinibacterium soli]|uniref:PmoA family protein n=1 Tax=Antiquaquibacter soli TaxID=3064523 RepID=A0ABT9BLP3_9MICO|nr:DUF6807 family protein [Protaetiibacter sp. WY-16]MDO7881925.1 PmoA family protein [Protaetiibacter sp. WY-16]